MILNNIYVHVLDSQSFIDVAFEMPIESKYQWWRWLKIRAFAKPMMANNGKWCLVLYQMESYDYVLTQSYK